MTGGLYPVSPAVMAWVSLNMSGAMKRAVGMALMISFSQLGGVRIYGPVSTYVL